MTDPGETRTSAKQSPAPGTSAGSDSFDHGRFAPGTLIGDRYRIVARLGVGGMGEVFRADDLTLGQPVALKFLPEQVERDPVRLDKFTAEVRTARQISHPNVCRVYDVGEVDGRRFLTMEYVDGEDLRSLLRRIGRLPEDKGLEIARQICAGLGAMHDRGVLHRDLKPANIMLDGRGRVRLTDFGLATAVAGAGADREVAGTPAYMAPEQLAGQTLSVATDLYAVGLVLFELFTGERVHKSDDPHAVRDAQRTAQSASLSASGPAAKLDPLIQRVIERCLDADPAKRPQSAAVVAAALPGGDPLAAALAAGETPSPQMVAAAGETGGLSLKVGVPLLIFVIAGMLLLAWLDGRGSYASVVSIPHSPEVLSSKAREMLGRLGHSGTEADSASGFRTNPDYRAWLDERDTGPTRWQHVASVRPPTLRFWYRSSPRSLTPSDYWSGVNGGGLAVTRLDPPMIEPGMTYVELDPEGRLVELDAVIEERVDPADVAGVPDWPALFREAGLEMSSFTPVEPEWVSRVESDATAAWTGPGADPAGSPLRVEAAAFRGRPVFFRLAGPWTRPRSEIQSAAGAERRQLAAQIIGFTLVLGIPLVAVVLSLRNVRLGRSDTRGATRLAAVAGCLALTASVLSSHFYVGVEWILSALLLAGWGTFVAMIVWAFYAAIEPYVRRRWPRMLISWSRLLAGRWRDPLVGRDLVTGSAIGVGLALINASLQAWRGQPGALLINTDLWDGVHLAAAGAMQDLTTMAAAALGIVMLLVVLRLLLRSETAAAIGVVAIFALVPALNAADPLVTVLLQVITFGTFVVVVTRFGLVTILATLFASGGLGGGFAVPGFAAGALAFLMAAKIAPAVFGFFTATRGRQKTAWLDG